MDRPPHVHPSVTELQHETELPDYSVVIPCYNVAQWVGEAIQSALDQIHRPVQIICVDDGSTDETLAVLHTLAAQHPVIRVIAQPNQGANVARNKGLDEARGEWLQFLDADDLIAPHKVVTQLRLASITGVCDLICGSYRRVSPNGIRTVQSGADSDAWVNLVTSRCGITSANLWKRQVVTDVGGWSPAWKSSQEYELMFRLLRANSRFAYSQDVHTTLRAREGSISSDFDAKTRGRHLRLRVDVLQYLESQGELVGTRRGTLHEAIFKLVRGLYPLDPETALQLRDHALPSSYVPPVSDFNGWAYVSTYRLIGMRGAERLRALLGRV